MFDLFSTLEQQEKLLSVREVAKLLQVSERSVRRMIVQRDFPSMLIGGQRRIDPSQLHRYFSRKNSIAALERRKSKT